MMSVEIEATVVVDIECTHGRELFMVKGYVES